MAAARAAPAVTFAGGCIIGEHDIRAANVIAEHDFWVASQGTQGTVS